MSLHQVAAARRPTLTRMLRRWAGEWNRVGEQVAFYGETVGQIGYAVTRYKLETMRIVAQMSLGVGALAIIGGAMVVVAFILLAAGGIVGVIGHAQLGDLGVDALGGFISAFLNTRLIAIGQCTVGLVATVGAGATAQLGAMRINEEVDALEVMGIPTIAYLASTRVVAGAIVVIPLFFTALMAAYVATRLTLVGVYGQSSGVYDHYFNTFLDPLDVVWSTLTVFVIAVVIMLIHTYYGLTASGGPAGVGEATGRAVRTSLIAAVIMSLGMTLALYGYSGHFHLSA
jgi:phospholipid/cholesterol/gamma-HCH transport system permease protein